MQKLKVEERGDVSIYSFLRTAVVSFKNIKILYIQQIILSQQFYPLFVNIPETRELRSNVSKVTTFSAIEDKK